MSHHPCSASRGQVPHEACTPPSPYYLAVVSRRSRPRKTLLAFRRAFAQSSVDPNWAFGAKVYLWNVGKKSKFDLGSALFGISYLGLLPKGLFSINAFPSVGICSRWGLNPIHHTWTWALLGGTPAGSGELASTCGLSSRSEVCHALQVAVSTSVSDCSAASCGGASGGCGYSDISIKCGVPLPAFENGRLVRSPCYAL